ncbi:MAG TPA: glutamine amidotransferase [Planctomycetaceae bacterium]|nr:glutamine amidotransferase [Planctomycetaceae bacterium]
MPHSTIASLIIGDRSWILPAVAVAIVGVLLAVILNWRRLAQSPLGPILRIVGWVLLCICLLNPLWSSSRPRSGANVVAVVADISRSHLVTTGSEKETRADAFAEALTTGEKTEPVGWLNQLGQDFELRRYTVADQLQQVDRFDPVEFNGTASSLQTALRQLKQRYEGQPLAGIILLSDGIATDATGNLDELAGMPPVFPVLPPDDSLQPDVAVGTYSVTQTAFDDAPVTIQVQPTTVNVTTGQVAVTLTDAAGTPIETQSRAVNDPSPLKFRHRPKEGGTVFYRLKATLKDASGADVSTEATAVNNEQLIAVERSTMPRRVLYVSGRPNWEFKFLRRAVEADPQLQMVALIRIARKEAKFDFRGREGESSNSLFRGFDKADPETVEEYDEPVLVRLGTKDDEELRGGFPEKAEELFQYDAIILDDLEADFFLADQMKLIYDFVSRRGGGLLMMGGQESFRQGDFDRTPIGEMLPIDLSREMKAPEGGVRLSLTRDGWLQPWVRLRSDENEETERLGSMPEFLTLNSASFVRPGAVIMAEVQDAEDSRWPALVVQRFGKGRTAALCIGDLWRWRLSEGLRKLHDLNLAGAGLDLDGPSPANAPGAAAEDLSDHARASRQMIRWLVADVPKRLDVAVKQDPSLGVGSVKLTAFVRGTDFEARENADVKFNVTGPDGRVFSLTGEPSDSDTGLFETSIAASEPGAWLVSATATISDDLDATPLTAATGWASQPDQNEMKSVQVDHTFLEQVAKATGGRTLPLSDLESFVGSLPESSAPLVEIWSWPIWHSWWVFLVAVACIAADWTLRRRRGLP